MAKTEEKELTVDEIVDQLQKLIAELVEIAKAAEQVAKIERRLDDLEATVFGSKVKCLNSEA